MYAATPFALLLWWLGRKFLNTATRLPAWDRWLRWLWVPGAVVVVLGFITSGKVGDWLDDWFFASMLVVALAVGWQLRHQRPALLIVVALLPYTVVKGLVVLLTALAPALLKRQDDLSSPLALAWLWLIGGLLLARNQHKTLTAEALRRQQALAEQQAIEAQKQALEREVGQRTAALAEQTDQLRATLQELQDTQSQLVQREKMASLGELTAGIAHEIQNPLNFVNNFADVSAELVAELEEERARPARDRTLEAELLHDLRENLQRITQHGGRASGIVRGMLAHSRAGSGERAPTDVNALCDEYLRLAYHGLRAKDKTFNATLETDFAPGLPLVEAVAGDLGRVLLNLLTNAFYAVQKRQQTGEAGYVPTVSVQTRQVREGMEIRVSDNGTGMPTEVQAKIFQPFFTTKPTGEGTGLGLSLAHDIIAQGHGGTLRVESAVGQGTTFTIFLPY
ncbi:MAG: ATP-binding protein [Janthinobacterium lividum]